MTVSLWRLAADTPDYTAHDLTGEGARRTGGRGEVSLDAGDRWASSLRSLLLVVPSVIVPEENNVLLNPLHSRRSAVTATKLRRFTYDQRLRRSV